MKITQYDPTYPVHLGQGIGVISSSSGSNTADYAEIIAAIGSNSFAAGSNSTRVAEIAAVGGGTSVALSTHYHDGIGTITASSSNTLQRGTVNLRAGTGVSFGLTDTDGDGEFDTLTVNSSASGGGGSALAVLDESVSLDSAVTSLNFTGAGVAATAVGHAITVDIPAAAGAVVGGEVDYVQITSPVTIVATVEASSTTIITGTSKTYDAVPHLAEVFFPYLLGSAASIVLSLWDGSTDLGLITANNFTGSTNSAHQGPTFGAFRFTPTSGTHQYIVKGYSTTASGGTAGAGAGGIGGIMPGYLRITKSVPINVLTGPGIGCKAYSSALQVVATGVTPPLNLNVDEFDTNNFHFTSSAALTGTVSKTASSGAIVGSGTSFTTELSVNQVISIPGTAVEIGVVQSITDNTHLTLWQTMANTASGQTATRRNEYMAIPAGLAGKYSIIGATTISPSATGQRILAIFKNDGTVGGHQMTPGNGTYSTRFSTSVDLDLVAGNYISVIVYQDSGANRNVGDPTYDLATQLSIMRIDSGTSGIGPGYEYDFAINSASDPAVTATTNTTANTITTGNAKTYDGQTTILIDIYAPAMLVGSTTSCRLCLYDNGTLLLDTIGWSGDSSGVTNDSIRVPVRLTPTAGSHQYSVRAYVSAGTTTFFRAGGSTSACDIRITKV